MLPGAGIAIEAIFWSTLRFQTILFTMLIDLEENSIGWAKVQDRMAGSVQLDKQVFALARKYDLNEYSTS